MNFTILGASGFIGRHLSESLLQQGHQVYTPTRVELGNGDDLPENLGHVIYAIGLTGDFRSRPFDTVEAHTSCLARLLSTTEFESWLYLSSTRVYGTQQHQSSVDESTPLVLSASPDNLYDLSKLTGEALCLTLPNPNIRVARLSNVFGIGQSQQTFLGSILHQLETRGCVTIKEASNSSKDYVSVSDAAKALIAIAGSGQQRLYNVASGKPITHAQIAEILGRSKHYTVDFQPAGPTRVFPTINTGRLRSEFPDCCNESVLDWLETSVLLSETL